MKFDAIKENYLNILGSLVLAIQERKCEYSQ